MNITVGTLWALAYFILMVGSVYLLFRSFEWRRNKMWWHTFGPVLLIVVFGWLSYYAGTHFRVNVNTRALLVNHITGDIVGVRDPGVQPRPLFGTEVYVYPANQAYELYLDLGEGTASASAKNGTALWIDTRMFLDLSEVDIVSAYLAVNGDWNKFLGSYLNFQMTAIVRDTSAQFEVFEHTTRRSVWEATFEQLATDFFADDSLGFGIQLAGRRTQMSWDFVKQEDAVAFDNVRHAEFLADQRTAELEVANIELSIAGVNAEILAATSRGTVDSLQLVADFLNNQPEEIRGQLVAYLQTQVNLEYLRLVGQTDPEVIFPPNAGPVITYDTYGFGVPTPTVTPSADENQ